MIVMLLMVVTAFSWAFAAASYAHGEEGWRTSGSTGEEPEFDDVRMGRRGAAAVAMQRVAVSSAADFGWNALKQIPNAPAVISHTFRKRLWLVVVISLAYGAVLLLGWGTAKLQEHMEDEQRRMTQP